MSEHDADRWGPLLSSERLDLARLADVVLFLMDRDRLPLRRAAAAAFDALGTPPTIGLFQLRPGDFAEPVTEQTEVLDGTGFVIPWGGGPVEPPSPGRMGPAAAVAFVRSQWTEAATKPADLDALPGGELALLASDAARLFGYGPAADAAGVSWLHVKGARWTDEETEHMEALRASGQTDVEIAKVFGCARQIVAQKIRSKIASKAALQTVRKLAPVR